MSKIFNGMIFRFLLVLLAGFGLSSILNTQSSAQDHTAEDPFSEVRHFSRQEGLSNNTVYSVVQDHQGFLWFGTQDGLNRFDGYQFKVFRHDPNNPDSLSTDNAGNLFVDHEGILWIGTWGGGLNRYDPKTGKFSHYLHDPNDPNSISDNRVQSLFEDRSGRLWFGTYKGGLNQFDRSSQKFTRYQHNPDDPQSFSHNRVWSIAEDHQGKLWVGTGNGLNRLNGGTKEGGGPSRSPGKFTHFNHDPNDPQSLSHNIVRVVYTTPSVEGRPGTLWLDTQHGLNRFNFSEKTFTRFLYDSNESHGVEDQGINSLFEDTSGRLWAGTLLKGLWQWDFQTQLFLPMDPPQFRKNRYS